MVVLVLAVVLRTERRIALSLAFHGTSKGGELGQIVAIRRRKGHGRRRVVGGVVVVMVVVVVRFVVVDPDAHLLTAGALVRSRPRIDAGLRIVRVPWRRRRRRRRRRRIVATQ